MACARHLGLIDLPIVCIDVDNYYQPFRNMLDRAHEDELIRLPPSQIVHFASNVEEAVSWCEEEAAKNADAKNKETAQNQDKKVRRRSSDWKRSSLYSVSSFAFSGCDNDTNNGKGGHFGTDSTWLQIGLLFLSGMALGVGVGVSLNRR